MRRRRILWAAAILLTALLYFFENNAGTLCLLVGSIFLPLLGLLPLFGRVSAAISAPDACTAGQQLRGTVCLKNAGLLPLPAVRLRVECCNLRTGEAHVQMLSVSLLPKESRRLAFGLDCPHCGTVCLRVTQLTLSDLLGMAQRSCPTAASAETQVLPELFHPEVVLADTLAALPDSDCYSAERPGNDPGETFAIREYVPGDAPRRIHWKLSEKIDRLMVRDFGLPVVNEVLLLFETAGEADAAAQDAMTVVFASLSAALRACGCAHEVGWAAQDGFRSQTVASEEDFDGMLHALLRLPPEKSGSVAKAFAQAGAGRSFAHIAVVAPQIPTGLRELHSGNRVSVLLCGQGVEGLQPDGTRLICFDSADYAQRLCRVEV